MAGRKPKYCKKVVDKIVELIKEDTFTVFEICEQVGIKKSAFFAWQQEHPEFKEAIEDAHDALMQSIIIDAKHSLRKKINGYTARETKVVTVPGTKKDANGMPKPVIKEQTVVEKHFQPDTAAIIFTLTNGDPAHWKNRQNNEVTGADGKDLIDTKSIDELKDELKGLMKIINDDDNNDK